MSGLDVAFFGQLGRDPETRTSKTGRSYLRLNVRCGDGDSAQWISVLVFNDVDELGERLKKGGRVYVEGQLTADAWIDRDGKARARLSVMTWNCVENRIGRNKNKRHDTSTARHDTHAPLRDNLDDPLPF